MDLNLKGRTALVTGGSKGLGFASAAAMAREGVKLALAARTEDTLRKAAESIGAVPIVSDLSDRAGVLACINGQAIACAGACAGACDGGLLQGI